MQIEDTALPDVKLIRLERFADSRGVFMETWQKSKFAGLGVSKNFVMDAVSVSVAKGTVRGLHFQAPPHAQAKLVRVNRGRILDVAVDLRRGSPDFGRHASFELSAENALQAFIPEGFAHGFCTLEDDVEVVYKLSDYFHPELDGGVSWRDQDLAIEWPVDEQAAIVSEKDRKLPQLKDLDLVFAKDS